MGSTVRACLSGGIGLIAAASLALVPTAAASAARAVPSCRGSALAVHHSGIGGASGNGAMVLWFRNVSHSTCSVYGYPGLDTLGPRGRVERHAVRSTHSYSITVHHVRTVVLPPQGVAWAGVTWINQGDHRRRCLFATSIAVMPANTYKTVHFRMHISNCALQVHPTVAGGTGRN